MDEQRDKRLDEFPDLDAAEGGAWTPPIEDPRFPGHRFRHCLRWPSTEEWEAYQRSSIRIGRGKTGRTPEVKVNVIAARVKLWDTIAINVEGYRRGAALIGPSVADWKSKIPEQHKDAAIAWLAGIQLREEDEELGN